MEGTPARDARCFVLLISIINQDAALTTERGASLKRRGRVRARVVHANEAGVMVELGPASGFLPRWELRDPDILDLSRLIGRTMRLYVIGRTSRHVLLSELPPRLRRKRGAL